MFSLLNPVKEGSLAGEGVVQLLPGEHVLHHLGERKSTLVDFGTKSCCNDSMLPSQKNINRQRKIILKA